MTDHFAHANRNASDGRMPSPWVTAILAIASWLVIAGIAGIALVLGAG
jgi:hypothetical protein